ncbi:MAG TPA: hypothetical protein VMG32_06440 [Anaeromyxobacteraceae bacterium]|nr:hypothetical protein [Anaeromyxobacteraceae bacterium]
MTQADFERVHDGERVTFVLRGAFDRNCAWRLRSDVEREVGEVVVLDFTGAPEISDLGLAVLAHGLTRARHRVLCRGLAPHHLRVLSYCGVAVEASGAREGTSAPVPVGPPPSAVGAGSP